MIDTDVDCLIETLNQLINFNYPLKICNSPWMLKEMDRVELLFKELVLLRTFLSHSEETRYKVEKVKALVIRIIDVASEVEYMVDSFVSDFVINNKNRFYDTSFSKLENYMISIYGKHKIDHDVLKEKESTSRVNTGVPKEDTTVGFVQNNISKDMDHDRSLKLDDIMLAIQVIQRDISECSDHKIKDDLKEKESTSRVTTRVPKEDKIVGFDVEAREILDRLVGDQKKQDVISIVGMGGLGKTTLAKRAYYDPYVTYHFYIRGWVSVSQTYQNKDLLYSICSSLSLTNATAGEMSTKKLREVLYKGLKGKRYLIVIDDIWDANAWNDIRICFPDDNNGSRILVTTRLMNVALQMKPDSPLHLLRFLTAEESWDLLKQKVFAEDGVCPKYLQETGKQIAERCGGLPLAILVISGLLEKTEKTVEWWTRVLDSIGSIVSDPEQYMNTLALSYTHLPRHLKSCFLYFGAFPEDFKINVRKLLWLWIAEGFVKPGTENVAEEYFAAISTSNELTLNELTLRLMFESCLVLLRMC